MEEDRCLIVVEFSPGQNFLSRKKRKKKNLFFYHLLLSLLNSKHKNNLRKGSIRDTFVVIKHIYILEFHCGSVVTNPRMQV